MNGEDILFAMSSLGFENYAEALKVYLSKYREVSDSNGLISLLPNALKQQQNQSNRERILEGNAWSSSMMPGDKAEGGAGGAEYAGAEGSNAEGHPDANYMYGQAGHNGAGAGEGY